MRTALALLLAAAAYAQQPATPQPAPARGGGNNSAYGQAARLPARISNFAAQPATPIQPGQSATLVWATENPNGVTIDPDLGTVIARGSRQVRPAATTTYTLTVHGPNNQVLTKEVTVTVAGTTPVARATTQTAKKEIPHMPDGKPNLSGVYNSAFPGNFFPGGPPMNIAGVPGPLETKPALKAGAEKFKVTRGPTDAGLTSDCMPTGVPEAYYMPYQWQLIQGLDRVVILYEYPHLFRVIPTNGVAHPPDPDPTWMGDSVGHWEGDTLVVDTVGFNDKTELPGGFKHSESLHIVERFRRSSFETLEYQATIEDPNVFEKPYVVQRTFPLRQDLEKVDEFVCENNRDYTKLFK
jgi:hypothetical protein